MFRRSIAALCLAVLAAAPARADLATYVARPEPNYNWSLKGKSQHLLGTVYDLHLVSQVWQGITWEHALQIYVPTGVSPTSTVFLFNEGGKPRPESALFGLTLASKMNAPVVFILGIPNQPLFDGLKEDALIAETFVRCLESGDENWPLLFPMVKSLVKAMDATQAFAKKEWNTDVTGFVVSGASKRGWTTWLTAASDKRVKAIAPMVFDTLNFPVQLPHQLKSFGTYSEMIGDYTRRNLVPLPDTTAARKLWTMTDPYSYREKLTMPKLILNGANDRYWVADALNNYWDNLVGEKWVVYVPNAGHSLNQDLGDGKKSRDRAIDALTTFSRCQIHGQVFPKLEWKHDDEGGRLRVTVRCTPAVETGRVWVADSATRDFRAAKWNEGTAKVDAAGGMSAMVDPPATGFRAFFMEVDCTADKQPCRLSTQMRVIEPKAGQ